MSPIHQIRSLPTNSLPASAKVDFLHFLACNKPVVRTKLVDTSARLCLEKWCNKYNFFLRMDAESFACIARDTRTADYILSLDQSDEPHEKLLGSLLGYPECCSNFIALIGESKIDDFEKQVSQWNFVGSFKRIDPSNYLKGESLICHLPCSTFCRPSLKLANQALDFIQKNKHERCLSPWLIWIH